jgi:hypothetical protein
MTKSVPGIILPARSHPPDLFNYPYYCSMCRKNRATGSSPVFLSKQAMMSSGKMKNRFLRRQDAQIILEMLTVGYPS